MTDKASKITISVPSKLAKAAENFAALRTGGNLSRVFAEALRAHLEANGALPKPEDDRKQRAIDQLFEVMPIEEIEAEIARRTAASVSGEVTLVP